MHSNLHQFFKTTFQQTLKNVFPLGSDRLHFCTVSQKYFIQISPILMMKFLSAVFFLLVSAVAFGQGWERVLSGGGQDEARALANTPDGGYLLAGSYQGIRAAVIKTDADGFAQWTKFYGSGGAVVGGNAIAVAADTTIFVAGFMRASQFGTKNNIWLAKLDRFGKLIWEKDFGGAGEDGATSIKILADGNVLLAGFVTSANNKRDFWLAKFDRNGNKIWEQIYGEPDMGESARKILLAKNGDLVIVGDTEDGPDTDICVLRLDSNGGLIWKSAYGFDFVPNAYSTDAGYGIAEAEDGGLVVAGKTTSLQGSEGGLLMKIAADGNLSPTWFKALPNSVFNTIIADGEGGFFLGGMKQSSPTNENVYLVRVDGDGDVIWENTVGKAGPDVALASVRATDGGLAIAGRSSLNSQLGDTYIYLVKTKADGVVFTNYIKGAVFHDYNNDCKHAANEPIQKDWIVKIESADFVRYATTDENGFYQSLVDTGLYKISLLLPNDYWLPCQTAVSIPIFKFYDTIPLDLGVKAAKACPQNRVDVSAPLLRRCAENVYSVRYCNVGPIPSIDTRVEIAVDDFLKVTGSSIPWASVNGNVFTFNVGFLDAGECGNFDLRAWLNCDSTENGMAHCVRAHIFPDTICSSSVGWDRSLVAVEGKCDSGRVNFRVRNAGTSDFSTKLEFVIVEDQIIYKTAQEIPPLAPGKDSLVFSILANNRTYRIIAEQSPGYPGDSYPTAAVEGCKTDTTSNPISTGFYTMFPEDDAEAFLSADCQESNDPSFNPVFLKRGHPKGAKTEHFIAPDTDLDFLIRFVNTSTDTVRQVIVRDTLSAWLDPATVIPGAASHAYDFQVYAGGVVQFTIPNLLLLPGGSVGADASSSGFVKFRVSQKPNLPCNTLILNRAATFFDFNAPAVSNQTFHTVCPRDSSLSVKSKEIFHPDAEVNIYPNPTTDWATVEISGIQAKVFTLEIFDLLGRRVAHQLSQQPKFRFINQFSRGIYFYRLAADGRPIASGKLEKW